MNCDIKFEDMDVTMEESEVSILHECKEYIDNFFKYKDFEYEGKKRHFYKYFKEYTLRLCNDCNITLQKRPKPGSDEYVIITGDIYKYDINDELRNDIRNNGKNMLLLKGYIIINLKKGILKMKSYVCPCCDNDFYDNKELYDEHILYEEKKQDGLGILKI